MLAGWFSLYQVYKAGHIGFEVGVAVEGYNWITGALVAVGVVIEADSVVWWSAWAESSQ